MRDLDAERGMTNRELRQRVIRLYACRCVYCGERYEPEELTVDHVQPRVNGGDHSRGNVVACCRRCNLQKGGMAAWAFLADRPDLRANFLRFARHVWPRHRRAVEEAVQVRA